MRNFFQTQLKKGRSIFKATPAAYPPAWPLEDDDCPKPSINPQAQSPLFAKLSAELRIQIYQAVLTSPYQFLHIIRNRIPVKRDPKNPKKKKLGRSVAHFWCIDMESPYPTWQHVCYGEYLMSEDINYRNSAIDYRNSVINNRESAPFCCRSTIETDDKLLALLLTCRLIYCEGLPILYQDNIFHFKGIPSFRSFEDSLTLTQWQSIRHIHMSTLFTDDSLYEQGLRFWPPESMFLWRAAGLKYVRQLNSLKLDIVFRIFPGCRDLQTTTDNLVLGALEPLKEAKAKVFKVEMNIQPSEEVWRRLGEVNFLLEVKERPFNTEVYGTDPLLEHTAAEY